MYLYEMKKAAKWRLRRKQNKEIMDVVYTCAVK